MTDPKETQVEEAQLMLTCGNCVWFQRVDPPKNVPPPEVGRGYCMFNPPAVFPMPHENKIQAMGQKQLQMVPMMIRPVVEENEPMCGRYGPNPEAQKALGLIAEGGCGGCKHEGDPNGS